MIRTIPATHLAIFDLSGGLREPIVPCHVIQQCHDRRAKSYLKHLALVEEIDGHFLVAAARDELLRGSMNDPEMRPACAQLTPFCLDEFKLVNDSVYDLRDVPSAFPI